MIEFENSDNIKERMMYASWVKGCITKWESQLPEIAKLDDGEVKSFDLNRNKEAIKNLKIKLSNYDIYNQKTKCSYCQETQCICYEANRSNQNLSQELQQGNETGPVTRSETMEQIRRTTGSDSSDTGSIESIKLPF